MFPKLRCLAVLVAMLTTPSIAEETSKYTDDAMLVFDASGSMASMGYNAISTPRIVDARKALRQSLPDITPFRRLGLVIYGPGPKDECSNIDVRFPPLPNTARRIIGDVDRISPDGNTPLTEAVRIAAETLDTRKEPGTVVLITDGRETCGGATCRLAGSLAADGHQITVHVIGFKVRDRAFGLQPADALPAGSGHTAARCLSDQTGGKYVSTESTEELVRALQDLLGCPMLSSLRVFGPSG